MNCPNCHEQTKDPLTCNQCGSTFCPRCNPHFDHTGDICQACQERNTIEAIRDDSWTAKLRRWFNKAAPLPDKPELRVPLPWRVERVGDEWLMLGEESGQLVARFDDYGTARFACDAANSYFQLSMVTSITYNRIRAGDPFFNGGKEDCELWMEARKLIK